MTVILLTVLLLPFSGWFLLRSWSWFWCWSALCSIIVAMIAVTTAGHSLFGPVWILGAMSGLAGALFQMIRLGADDTRARFADEIHALRDASVG